jgi:polysaccharide export outer membrane protein
MLKGVVLIMFLRIVAVSLLCLMPLFFGCATPAPSPAAAGPEAMRAESQPTASEFTLGVGDSVEIYVYRHDDLKVATKINPSGQIMFPLIGDVQAAGKTLPALRQDLAERLSRYVVDPQVTISVTGGQSRKYLVLGEVKNPGAFTLDTSMTLLDAVAKAGGWTADAKTTDVILLRNASGKVETRSIDVASAFKSGVLPRNIALQGNDVVFVPTKKIADIARFMGYLSSIISPIVMTEGGIVLWPQMIDALNGKTSGSVAIPTR